MTAATASARTSGWTQRLREAWPWGPAPADEVGALPVRDRFAAGLPGAGTLAGHDRTLAAVVLAIVALGMVMVYSASIALPDSPKFQRYASTHFLVRHLMAIAIGTAVALVVVRVPMAFWEKHAGKLYLLALLLLVLVLLPFVGRVVNGSGRWSPLVVMISKPWVSARLAIALVAPS